MNLTASPHITPRKAKMRHSIQLGYITVIAQILSLRAGCVDIKAYMIPEGFSHTRAERVHISYIFLCVYMECNRKILLLHRILLIL